VKKAKPKGAAAPPPDHPEPSLQSAAPPTHSPASVAAAVAAATIASPPPEPSPAPKQGPVLPSTETAFPSRVLTRGEAGDESEEKDVGGNKQAGGKKQLRAVVEFPSGDALDRAAVNQALWTRREAIMGSVGRRYLVVVWSTGERGRGRPRRSIGGGPRVHANYFLYKSEDMSFADDERSPFHSELRKAADALEVSNSQIAVVVVDPAVRRSHSYTYLVVVTFPWMRADSQISCDAVDDARDDGGSLPPEGVLV